MLRQLCPKFSPVRRKGRLAATLWLAWLCSVIAVSEEAIPRAIPCPNEADILPCVCTAYEDFTMDMNCSAVTSSNELAHVFSASFPFLDFNSLDITDNPYITTLRVGDLGEATFQIININGGRLESVVAGALSHSYDTLHTIDLSNNHVTDFPFDELSSFIFLDELYLEENALSLFPHIYSSSLRILHIGFNPWKTISSTAFKDLPNLEDIGLHSSELTSIEPGTLTGLPRLEIVHLEDNYLSSLQPSTIAVTGSTNLVHLNNNLLTSIAVGAIVGANYEVWIYSNDMTELNEDVWGPMFDANVRLSARDNPFTCGCEIAWIVLNAYYLENLVDDPTCSNGELITNLDPAVFSELCT